MANAPSPLVGIVVGARADWETMQHSARTLDELGVPHEVHVLSAHRTPGALEAYVNQAELRGLEVLIAGAGGAAHLAGVCAAKTVLPVLGVPMAHPPLNGLDALLATVQMSDGVPVGTFAIGKAGAINAALFATAILGGKHAEYREAIRRYREKQTESVLANPDPRKAPV